MDITPISLLLFATFECVQGRAGKEVDEIEFITAGGVICGPFGGGGKYCMTTKSCLFVSSKYTIRLYDTTLRPKTILCTKLLLDSVFECT